MTPICARPTCSAPASVRLQFDGSAGLVILDTIVTESGVGMLCQRHADRLGLPKGWKLEDRRILTPRLFPVARFDQPVRSLTSHIRRLAPVPDTATPLPLDDGAGELAEKGVPVGAGDSSNHGSADFDTAFVNVGDRMIEVPVHPDQATFDIPDQRTPLLARAFETASQRVRPTSALASLIPRAPDTSAAG